MSWFTKKKLDFLAIGDITTDAFITLKDAEVTCEIDKENCKLCVQFGQKIPYERVDVVRAVGNAANAAVAAKRLGLVTGLLVSVGNDDEGKAILAQLKHEGIDTKGVTVENGKTTNYHYVLRYGAERTILIKHETFTYKLPAWLEQNPPKWIYLTSIAENSLPYHAEIAAYAKRHPEVKVAFQPGTFQIKLGIEKLRDIYAISTAFFCNKDEAKQILNLPHAEYPELHAAMRALGPKIVCITDGPNGATISDESGGWFIPMYPDPKEPVSRTGAGDACSSTIVAALIQGLTPAEALVWGPVNSMSVVQHIGAQGGLLWKDEIEKELDHKPENYRVEKIF